MPLGAIRPRDVAAYTRQVLTRPRTRKEPLAATTVNLHLTVLFDLMKTARREELIDTNPVEGVERPRIVRRR
jgi:hypothetical protein